MSNCFSTPCPPSSAGPCPSYPLAKCVTYTGSNLLCSGIKTNDRLDTILQKIDALFCTGGGGTGSTFIEAGLGIDIDGVGTSGNPYVISSTILANNGLTLVYSSLISPPYVKLGQVVGEAGDPARLLYDGEIPLGDFSLDFNNKSGTGATTSHITMDVGNSSGISLSQLTLEATDSSYVKHSVNNTTGTLGSSFYGSGTILQGTSGYSLSGAGGHFFFSNMIGGTTHSTVEIAGVVSQEWNVTGDTTIGLTGTKNTGFGGITAPTAFVDVAASTSTQGSIRWRAGSTPSSGYLDGLTWYDGTHVYMRIAGANKQLDNDSNINPGDFIQNQFLLPQSANFWIDGHGRIDDYLQIEDSARLIKDSTGLLSVTDDASNTLGSDMRLRRLRFFTDAPGFYDVPSDAYIYSTQPNFLDLYGQSQINLNTPSIAFNQAVTVQMGAGHPLRFIGSVAGVGEFNYINIYNNNSAGDSKSVSTKIGFEGNRTTGGKTLFANVSMAVADFSNTLYKGDLVFETVSASVNSGSPTEYMRLKYDGRLFVNSLDTDGTAPTTTGATKTVVSDSTGLLSFIDTPQPGLPAVPISILQAALAANIIDNGNFKQTWKWDSLTAGPGLTLSSNSTTATYGQAPLGITTTGLNATSDILTTGLNITNTHSGTNSINQGLSIIVNKGRANYGIIMNIQETGAGVAGNIWGISMNVEGAAGTTVRGIALGAVGGTDNISIESQAGDIIYSGAPNQATPDRIITQISSTDRLGYVTLGTGLSVTGGILNATIAGLQTFQSTLTTGSTLTGANSVAGGGFNFAWNNMANYTIEATGTTFFKIAGYGSATNGDVLTVTNIATGQVGWATPGGGGGGVSSVSIGNLSPLFTASVATATTTPAISFALSNAAANTYLGNSTGGATSPSYTTAGALTAVNDTNIVLTAGGNATTSLLRAASITASWSGTLSVARGGTALSALGSALQVLRVNAGATALEYVTPPWLTTAVTTLNTLTAATQTFAVGSAGTDFNISSVTSTHTFNIPTAGVGITRGLITNSGQTIEGLKTLNVGIIVNNSQADSDVTIKTQGNATALFVDASTNRLGLFTAAPAYPVDITGNTQILSGGLGIGTAPTAAAPITLGGSGWTSSGIILLPSVSAGAGTSPSIISVAGTLIEAPSGTHPIMCGLLVNAPTITSGLSTVTNTASLYVSNSPTATVTGGNYAILVASGSCRFNGDFVLGTTSTYSSGGYKLAIINDTSGRIEKLDPDVLTLNVQSGLTYTLVLTDKGSMVQRTNASAQTLTIPTNASVAFPIGTMILIEQTGAGQITFVPAGGVTMNSAGTATKSRVQFVICTLIKTSSSSWTLSGDITT